MINLLAKIFIKNRTDITDGKTRYAYGILCGITGILLNIILFAIKLFAGIISGSIAITADSFNNFGDAITSIITLLGFYLSKQKPDQKHPFGHGRLEYVSGVFVSVIIIVAGFELGKSSISKIIKPHRVEYNTLTLIILVISVIVKLYMSLYNNRIGKKISSSAMIATSSDSISDAVATTVVLATGIISRFFVFNIDGYAGALVSLFILRTGFISVRDTITPLLGQSPSEAFVKEIEETVKAHKEISAIHDLVVHDYGPGRTMISLHAEVPVDINILIAHDVIDNIEIELFNKLGCHATIHMDPVITCDEFTNNLKNKVSELASEINNKVTIHDFRIVEGQSSKKLIFDAVVPYNFKISDEDFIKTLSAKIKGVDETYNSIIVVDRSYTDC